MSFLHRAPRQVYRVYGQDEYIAEGHVTADAEYFHETEDSGSYKHRREIDRPDIDGPEIDAAVRSSGSRTHRLVGIGLLLGVTVGAAGLVLSHLSHEASPPRGSSPAHPISRRVSPAESSRPFPHRVSGEASAYPEPESQIGSGSTRRRSVSGYSPSRFAAHRRTFGSAFTARAPIESRRSASTQTIGVNWGEHVVASVTSEAPASSAAFGGEFEFERQAP